MENTCNQQNLPFLSDLVLLLGFVSDKCGLMLLPPTKPQTDASSCQYLLGPCDGLEQCMGIWYAKTVEGL